MSIRTILLLILITAPFVAAQGAQWVEVNVKHNWDRRSSGFCNEGAQCLVSNAFNETWDNMPDRYWSQVANWQRPKCINHTQYISDNYCENGEWTSRTKLLSKQLLAIALDKAPTSFSLYCDNYKKVLNRYQYRTDYGLVTNFLNSLNCLQAGNKRKDNCVNNICVMKYNNNIAIGTAINTDISGEKSPLQALNLSKAACNNAKQSGGYNHCGFGVWYNHDLKSMIYTPALQTLPAVTTLTEQFFMDPYNKLNDYVFKVVHQPTIQQQNYTFFNFTPKFNQIYMAKDQFDFAYSFREQNITLVQRDYAGWFCFSYFSAYVDC